MSDPEVVHRARSLLGHIAKLGGHMDEYYIAVSKEEGLELLTWYRNAIALQDIGEGQFNLTLLDRDIRKAKQKGDPFPILEHFKLFGLTIKPLH